MKVISTSLYGTVSGRIDVIRGKADHYLLQLGSSTPTHKGDLTVRTVYSTTINQSGLEELVDMARVHTGPSKRECELIQALADIQATLLGHPQVHTGNSKVHYAYHVAKGALTKHKEEPCAG